ncbi:glycosyltransferase [Kutzneria kofuensis]|uniref:UDP:flavonoid glycosyltransferase YjiC (YdhE family) n=1 Tax=Kutzneria kofuensis TaxID=103725 RepID=A0A7W9KCH2_9PSEU|nr:nucleotide disphospho-sugar-binding domain-containing protein [Kutzneria kofuensis]MBB5890057.1 UDP:flavonoid glycosyltransferase YjiC (YdhE family) [Kutzneria kofuensis]
MRVLLSSIPQHGHLLPLLPLARALRAQGDEVAFMSGAGVAPVLNAEDIPLFAAGPMPDVLGEEAFRRTGDNPFVHPTPQAGAAFFVDARIDLGGDEALAAGRSFQPDLVIRERLDYLGPLVAADRGVPLATLAFGPEPPPALLDFFDAQAQAAHAARNLSTPTDTWFLDTCPPSLQVDGWQRPAGWHALRPEPHRDNGATAPLPTGSPRPRVLVTYGTWFNTPEKMSPMLRELSNADVDIVATLGLASDPSQYDVDPSRVTFVPFMALDTLLDGVEVVLTHGGAGTTLGSMARGIPMVVTPAGADNFLNGAQVAAAGAGIVLQPDEATPTAVAEAVRTVLAEFRYREAAASVAKEIAAMPTPAEVAAELRSAVK